MGARGLAFVGSKERAKRWTWRELNPMRGVYKTLAPTWQARNVTLRLPGFCSAVG